MAVIKYYSSVNGSYEENPQGLLLGIEWTDANGNLLRDILYLPDFSTLQQGLEMMLFYHKEVMPAGFTDWISNGTGMIRITNNIEVERDSENLAEAFGKVEMKPTDPPVVDPIGQLDFFIGLYFRGDIPYPPGQVPPIYQWLAEVMAAHEGETIS